MMTRNSPPKGGTGDRSHAGRWAGRRYPTAAAANVVTACWAPAAVWHGTAVRPIGRAPSPYPSRRVQRSRWGQQQNWHVRKGQSAEDAVPAYIWSLYTETTQGRTKATVTLEGSLDQHSSASFRECVDEALGAHPAFVVVDAQGLTFVDAAGLAALVRARRAASEAGVAFRVSDASPALRHVAEDAGFRALLPDE
jgi:anti-anti-sigma factor